ncbi:hypothetical protein OTK49_03335 [Vibrio coralliirubri]|uniref:hypothetical protein n=1 Tax=Vibrio coralliirubri TaxID=1516159 RepID=UPI002284E2FF|nr:hypothetical protein [Vibrio coralliirubri]MCY9861550.1 hypothetical protein [Vibrio coralliirubri]
MAAASFFVVPQIQKQILEANTDRDIPLLLELIADSKKMCQKLRTSLAQALWADLDDTPVNDNDELKTNWLIFDKGDDLHSIWHWFERTFNITLAYDL